MEYLLGARRLALCFYKVISGSPCNSQRLVLLSRFTKEETEAQTGRVVP